MNAEKSFTKATIIKVVIILLVVAALLVAVLFGLRKCQNDSAKEQDGKDGTSQTEPSSKETESDGTEPAAESYTVTFQDHNGIVLNTQEVAHGNAAQAPADPTRAHFTFVGWDKPFDNITSDLVVTATYTTTRSVVSVETVQVNKGTKEVTVNIRVLNNPGIMGAVLQIAVDDEVFAFAKGENTQYPGLTLTTSGPGTTASPYTFMLDALELSEDDKKDGTLFTVTFTVKDTAPAGRYEVNLSCDPGAFFDEVYADPQIVLENGYIVIA